MRQQVRLIHISSSSSTADNTCSTRSSNMALAAARPALSLKLVAQWSNITSSPFVPRRVSDVQRVGAMPLGLILTLLRQAPLWQGRNSRMPSSNSARIRSAKVFYLLHEAVVWMRLRTRTALSSGIGLAAGDFVCGNGRAAQEVEMAVAGQLHGKGCILVCRRGPC